MLSADVSASGVVVDSSVELSLQLLCQLYDPSANLVFSPYSIMAALMMVLLGTGGNSRDQLLQVLFGSTKESGIGQFISMHHQLSDENAEQLIMNNMMYPSKSITIKPQYRRQIKRDFSACIKRVNFAEEASALKTINSDVSEATRGMIPRLLAELDPNTDLILINTVYFNAKWVMPFYITNKKDTFIKESGEKVTTPIMRAAFQIPYTEKSGVKAVFLPYSGSDISMVLLLPPKGRKMGDFLRELKGAFLDTLLQELATSPEINFEDRVSLALPRFKVSSTHDALKENLRNLGVTDIFSSKKANFSKLTAYKPFWVSEIIQKATIECAEEGTKAAVATADAWVGSSRYTPPPPTRDFIADHPFVYSLVRIPKNAVPKQILFMGVIEDPSKSN